ncbi:MAG: hypothetical protein Q9162_000285 [Coniocarpon cinnabarinum]
MSAITSSPFVHPGAYSLNRGITYGFIGLSHYVHALWNYSNRGIVFEVYTALSRNLALKNILPAPGPMSVRRFLQQYFLLIPGSGFGWHLLGAAISHQGLEHLLANMLTLQLTGSSLARFLPPLHYVELILASAVASSLATVHCIPAPLNPLTYRVRDLNVQPVYRFTAALGASGVLSALTVCAAAFEPNRLVKPYGIPVPVPMWAAAVGYNFVDLMIMQSGIESQVSHVTHLAGAATGLVWYILLGRQFGGPRSWLRPRSKSFGGDWGPFATGWRDSWDVYGGGRRLG